MSLRTATLGVTAGLCIGATAASGLPARTSARVTLADSTPGYARASLRVAGVPGDRPLRFGVVLGLRDPAGAERLAAGVSDPASPSYHHFVTAQTFRRRFSWRSRDVEPVVRWLRRSGLSVGAPPRNRLFLPVSGTAGDFARAFATELAVYRVAGEDLVAPDAPLSVPRPLARLVQGTTGIPETRVRAGSTPVAPSCTTMNVSADPGPPPLCFFLGPQPPAPACSTYWAQFSALQLPITLPPTPLPPAYGQTPLAAVCGYSARQIRSAYGVERMLRNGYDGRGVDIGIVTAYLSPTLQDDLNRYSDLNAIPRTKLLITKPGSYEPAPDLDIWDDYTEQTLDVQVSHGMAPRAHIHYAAPNGLNHALESDNAFVDRNVVDVISNSWAGPEVDHSAGGFRLGEAIFTQAAAQGITMLFSSGDQGDGIEKFGLRTVQYPASSPHVTAVGGTTLAVGPQDNWMWEQGWGDRSTALSPASGAWDPPPPGNPAGGSTGGTSRVFHEPGYQRALVPKRYWHYFGGRARVVPDVALIGDPMTGPGLVQTGVNTADRRVVTHHSIGGTSVASPVFAGAVAVMVQRNGGRLGFLNPALYRMRGGALRDIGPVPHPPVAALQLYANFENASGGYASILVTGGRYGTLHVRNGYDDVTGLGSPLIPTVAARLRTRR
jgi:subtilase family serine protease